MWQIVAGDRMDDMMHIPLSSESDQAGRKNLRWLFTLRTMVLFSEAMIIAVTVRGLGINLNETPLWAILTLMSGFNWWTWMRIRDPAPIAEYDLFLQLCTDVSAISLILYFTGGANNPIAWFFLLPLIIAATIMPRHFTWYLVIFATGCYTFLINFHHQLPEIHPLAEHHIMSPMAHALMEEHNMKLHAFGMWFGFVFSAILVAYFVQEMAETLRQHERKLADAREQALRSERVVALGSLAAGAAHEMGTPLATIAILVGELEQDFIEEAREDMCERMAIMRDQIKRCKAALSVMSATAGDMRAESGHIMPLPDYLDSVVDDWNEQQLKVPLGFYRVGVLPPPSIIAERTLTHALVNILNNAAEVSPEGIRLEGRWTRSEATLDILDSGPGISPALSQQLGKVPVTTKDHGMGVGLFLAFATVERAGGSISMQPRPQGGTRTRIILPLMQNFSHPSEEYTHDTTA
jgi:two-component system sensor histidine kinase RegB